MMNQVMQRPMFRQQGSPMGGEQAFMQYLQTTLSPEQLQSLMQNPNRDQIIGQLYKKFMTEQQQVQSSPMVMRQEGSPQMGEKSSTSVPPFLKFDILDKLGVISNKSLNREVPNKDYKINLDDAMTNPQLLDTVFEMITNSTDFDFDAFMNMGSDQQGDYLKTIKGRLIFDNREVPMGNKIFDNREVPMGNKEKELNPALIGETESNSNPGFPVFKYPEDLNPDSYGFAGPKRAPMDDPSTLDKILNFINRGGGSIAPFIADVFTSDRPKPTRPLNPKFKYYFDKEGKPQVDIREQAEGGEMNSDAVGIADGLDQEEPMTTDRDPSQEGIAKVSPEQYVQLMNEVRGDEVPMEGRVQELASVVGEKDATETPLSVLALVQPVFEMKEQQGIAQTQQGQQMMAQGPMPMASDQLANPQNMGIVRANTGLIVDAPFDYGNQEMPTTIPNLNSSPVPFSISSSNPTTDFMDASNTLMSDFMKQYITPVKMDATTLQSEIDLLRGIMGDSKAEGRQALATTGVDLGLRLAAGEDPNTLLREGAANFFAITKAVKDQDKAIALQAYKSLLARKNSMSEREFGLAKMGLENQLKVIFEQSKGMQNPVYLRDPKTDVTTVLDGDKDQIKIANLIANNFEVINVKGGQTINIENIVPQTKSQGDGSGLKEGGEVVKRSTGSTQSGETSDNKLLASSYTPYEELMEGIETGEYGVSKEDTLGKGSMELIQDQSTINDYQKRIVLSNELEDLFQEAISLIEGNNKLAGLVGDFMQLGQRTILPINQIFAALNKKSPIPDSITQYLSDPDIQRLATLENQIPQKLIDFTKDLDSARIPALNRILDEKSNLRISGLSDATVATDTLKGLLKNVRNSANYMREAIGRDKIDYGSKLNQILSRFDLTEDNDLVKEALEAIEERPEAESRILQSLFEKLQQQSGQ
jgi:hypothetical protein